MCERNASAEAYEWLEARVPGGYERLVSGVMAAGGVLVQAPGFLLAFVVEDGVADVVFGYGCLREMVRFGRANGGVFGCERVSWVRGLVGKHDERHFYNINKLRLCKRVQESI